MSAQLAAQVIGQALSQAYPDTKFFVQAQGREERDRVVITWDDAPRGMLVRALTLEATDHFTTPQRGWKLVYRHGISREMRLRAREAILADYPDYDYITEIGDMNPDSPFRWQAPPVRINGELVTCNGEDGNALLKEVAFALLRLDGVADV
jgi:hypothetical protein